jgi:hypothetical protein
MRRNNWSLFTVLAALALPAWAADPPPSAPTKVSEPTAAELQRLYRERIAWINQGSVKFLGEQGAQRVMIRFDSLQKAACETQDRGVYLCQVFVDSAYGKAPAETRRLALTLVRDGDDWRLK